MYPVVARKDNSMTNSRRSFELTDHKFWSDRYAVLRDWMDGEEWAGLGDNDARRDYLEICCTEVVLQVANRSKFNNSFGFERLPLKYIVYQVRD